MLIWIFNSSKESKQFIEKKNITLSFWDRIIVGWDEQTSYERDWNNRKNINWIYIVWNPWTPWKPWKDWKDARIDYEKVISEIYNRIDKDPIIQKKLQWRPWTPWTPWKPWKDWIVDYEYIISMLLDKLINNELFIEKLKWKDWYTPIKWKDYFDWKDWYSPIKWKDYFDWKDWEDWIDWQDSWKVVLVDPNNIELKSNELWIDLSKNLYIIQNNTILKI